MKRLDPRSAERAQPVEFVARLLRVIADASTCPQSSEVSIVFKKNFRSHGGTIGTGCLIDAGSSDVYVVFEVETHPRSRFPLRCSERFSCISAVLEHILHKLPELDLLQRREAAGLESKEWLAEIREYIAGTVEESESDDK